jgi:hypothetical protein
MDTQPVTSTQEQLNNLIEFRQQVYEEGFLGARDAQFDLLDALLTSPGRTSFAELTCSPLHRRGWSSAYAALADGQQDWQRLGEIVLSQLPDAEVLVLSLDSSTWVHRRARTLHGLVLEPLPGTAKAVPVHLYSMLAWVPEAHRSWALPLSTERVPPVGTEVQTGVAQVEWVCARLPATGQRVVVADGRYGNHKFLGGLRDLPCGAVVRLRKDRVFYHDPPPYTGRGRPRKHGAAFRCADATTWGDPDEEAAFAHDRYGRVRLRCWHGLHAKADVLTRLSVILAEVQLGEAKHPAAMWLGSLNLADLPVQTVWSWYIRRWPIEPAFRFRKHRLAWTVPRFQHTLHCDRWTVLVDIAYWMVFLARHLVADQPLPWQKPQQSLTPGRVLHGLPALLARLGSPAQPPQPRGKSPGWPPGRPRDPPARHAVVKRMSIKP